MLARLSASSRHHPLAWLTLFAALPRLVAAIFSGGYFAQDDHFLVIEAAQSWVDGYDYNFWLPWNQHGSPTPTGHMMVYPGLHFLLFKLLQWLGMSDPQWKMVCVRLLHAAWSLITVRVGYRIALRLTDASIAWRCGLFLALLFFMPFLSVRNLVEMVSAPLLMLSAWHLLRGTSVPHAPRALLLAGLFAGLAINIRFQTIFFPAAAGGVLLLHRRWIGAAAFAAGTVLPIALLQGSIDLFIWGRPFVEMTEYVRYNLANPTNTGIDLPWYNYLLLLAGVFVPPLSLAVLVGFFRDRRPFVLWFPVLVFIFFHSIFPNKQERFLLPIVPLFFVLGYCTWERARSASTWWKAHAGLWRGVMIWTWSLNALLLVPLTLSFSKHERVEAMAMLRTMRGVNGFIIEDTVEHDPPMPPLFYWGRWDTTKDPYTDPTKSLRKLVMLADPPHRANVILFVGDERLPERLARATEAMGPLEYAGCARPGLLDRTLHWLNPVNRNEVILLFKVRA